MGAEKRVARGEQGPEGIIAAHARAGGSIRDARQAAMHEQRCERRIRAREAAPEQPKAKIHIRARISKRLIESAQVLESFRQRHQACAAQERNLAERVLNIAHEESMALWKKMAPQAGERELARLYDFFSHGSAAVIRSWVLSGMRDTPEEIASFIERISAGGLAQIAGK